MTSLADYRHSPTIRVLLNSLVTVICPPKALELGLKQDIVDHVQLSMQAIPTGVRVALLAGLTGYDWAAMAIPKHLGKRASRLSRRQAAAYFEAWYHSKLMPQHEFAKGIKSLICLACYEQPAMMASIGYTPQDWIDKSTKHRLTTYASDIEKHKLEIIAADLLPNVTVKQDRELPHE